MVATGCSWQFKLSDIHLHRVGGNDFDGMHIRKNAGCGNDCRNKYAKRLNRILRNRRDDDILVEAGNVIPEDLERDGTTS